MLVVFLQILLVFDSLQLALEVFFGPPTHADSKITLCNGLMMSCTVCGAYIVVVFYAYVASGMFRQWWQCFNVIAGKPVNHTLVC